VNLFVQILFVVGHRRAAIDRATRERCVHSSHVEPHQGMTWTHTGRVL
jgi:hypothetical protein